MTYLHLVLEASCGSQKRKEELKNVDTMGDVAMEEPAGSTSTDQTDKPLLELVKRLVGISADKNTNVNDSLVKEILIKEFNMSMTGISELNREVYFNVLKKFLKSWPAWDSFDNNIRQIGDNPTAKAHLTLEYYHKLKEYLQKTLTFTTTQLDSILDKIQTKKSKHLVQKEPASEPAAITATSTNTVIMEVSCSRDQLNQLFYWKPHPKSLTIFNITEEPSSSKISVAGIQLKEILNWPHVAITVTLPNFEFIRRNSSHFERTLVNKKLVHNQVRTYAPLPVELYWKTLSFRRTKFRKNVLVSHLVQVCRYIEELEIGQERKQQMIDLFNEFKSDMLMLMNYGVVNSEYQYFLSKHPYIRRLCTKEFAAEDETLASEKITEKMKESVNPNDFDLHLEEMICPATTFQLCKFFVKYKEDHSGRIFDIDYPAFTDSAGNWLKIECTWCEVKFEGYLNIYTVVQHFNENHSSEPDWQCSKCNKTFTMAFLARNRWLHDC